MKVLIFGNIGSGKTTIINKLKEVFPWEVNAIDDYRRRYGDGTKENELIAQNFFYEAIKKSENQIIECLGIGTVSEELHSILCQNDEKLLCVKIITSKNICLSRLEKRIWDIPFPKPIDKVIELVDRTEDRIKAGSIEALWGKRNNTTIITKENSNFENLNEIVCEIAEEVLFILNPFKSTNEIENMLDKRVQDYYSIEYNNYQKSKVQKTKEYTEDQIAISKFISDSQISGNLVDIGSGSCQWFPLFENKINKYYAVDVNSRALSLVAKNKKLITINQNIFNNEFVLENAIPLNIDCVIFSFFLSHYSDSSIAKVFTKINSITTVLIIDTLWCEKHKLRYASKELSNIKRKISEDSYIQLPKRFFEYSDIENFSILFNYKITNFIEGNYCFACIMRKEVF